MTILDGTNPTVPDNVLEALVGEGKTYKTAEDLAKGKLNADVHISKIELENKEMREKLAAAKTVEDLLEKINANAAPVVNNDGSTTSVATTPGMTAEQIAKLVEQQIQGRETATAKASNLAKAEAKLKALFGDKAKEVFDKEASNPVIKATMLQLAEVDPDKFISLFQRSSSPTGVDTGQNGKNLNVNFQDSSTIVPGTQRFYSEMRKKEPAKYYSSNIQLEMHQAALADPNKYFNS